LSALLDLITNVISIRVGCGQSPDQAEQGDSIPWTKYLGKGPDKHVGGEEEKQEGIVACGGGWALESIGR
jgi:hypothetical protein